MCGRYVITNPVSKTKKIVKSAIQVEDGENYNAHPDYEYWQMVNLDVKSYKKIT